MQRVIFWAALVELIAPSCPQSKGGRPSFSLETVLRVHFMQQWFSLSDRAMKEALFNTSLCRKFVHLHGEQKQGARAGDAFEPTRQTGALWHEGYMGVGVDLGLGA